MRKVMGAILAVTLLTGMLAAATASLGRYDRSIAQRAALRLASKKQFRNVRSMVEDGIISLSGSVDLYQDKLDAAQRIGKVEHAQGVRNLIEVRGPAVNDAQLQAKLEEKLRYDRIGYDNLFNYFRVSVEDGVVTVDGEALTEMGRDSALGIIQRTPGVKDVVNNIRVSPVSSFDDQLRIRTAEAIYGDSVLGRYSIDPAHPIRIIVDRGTVNLYGTVANAMDKQVAGMRAAQVFGAFRVENHLAVDHAA